MTNLEPFFDGIIKIIGVMVDATPLLIIGAIAFITWCVIMMEDMNE